MKTCSPFIFVPVPSTTWRGLVALLACSLVGLATIALLVMPGCSTPKAGRLSESAGDLAELDAGYTLLYELLDDEAQVDNLLVIKSASPGTTSLLEDIAESCARMREQLGSMAESDDALTLELTGLPKVETSARIAISSETAMALLGASDDEFEFNVLLSQEKAMSYGAHLAASLSQSDPDAGRTRVLEEISSTMHGFHDRIMLALKVRCSGN